VCSLDGVICYFSIKLIVKGLVICFVLLGRKHNNLLVVLKMLILLSRLTVTSTTKPIFTEPGDLRPPQLGAEFGVLLELIVSFNEKHPS
jgi:hypothetical protein